MSPAGGGTAAAAASAASAAASAAAALQSPRALPPRFEMVSVVARAPECGSGCGSYVRSIWSGGAVNLLSCLVGAPGGNLDVGANEGGGAG
jgi:hypothetical protein